MQFEAQFNEALKEILQKLEYHKTIEWWERLASGRVETVRGGWMQLCRKNTPDWVVVFYDKRNNLFILFVEGKSDSGMLVKKEGQDEFMNKFNEKKNFRVMRTNSVDEVKNFINENSFDKMNQWSDEIDLYMGLVNEELF